jgi:hypothetical protein
MTMMQMNDFFALSALLGHGFRAVERLLIVGIAGLAVFWSYRLAQQAREVLRAKDFAIDAKSWKTTVGTLVVPTAALPLAAACAFIGLGLTPVDTQWQGVGGNCAAQTTTGIAGTGGTFVQRNFGGAADGRLRPELKPALEASSAAFRDALAASDVASADDEQRLRVITLREVVLALAGLVYGARVEEISRVNVATAGGTQDLTKCPADTARDICSSVQEVARLLSPPTR